MDLCLKSPAIPTSRRLRQEDASSLQTGPVINSDFKPVWVMCNSSQYTSPSMCLRQAWATLQVQGQSEINLEPMRACLKAPRTGNAPEWWLVVSACWYQLSAQSPAPHTYKPSVTGRWHTPLIPALGRQRQVGLWDQGQPVWNPLPHDTD